MPHRARSLHAIYATSLHGSLRQTRPPWIPLRDNSAPTFRHSPRPIATAQLSLLTLFPLPAFCHPLSTLPFYTLLFLPRSAGPASVLRCRVRETGLNPPRTELRSFANEIAREKRRRSKVKGGLSTILAIPTSLTRTSFPMRFENAFQPATGSHRMHRGRIISDNRSTAKKLELV